MKNKLTILAGVVAVSVFVAGCGNDAPKMSSQEKALFENSTPEIKQLFETALTADKANNYLSASTNYQALSRLNLSADQASALATGMKSLKQRIFDAAAKGDAAAQKAVEDLKNLSGAQGRPGRPGPR
jgi:hypothetical protein